jgi:S-adenosylmethionine:tRNA ribosyltransferase-isomerase
MNFISTKYEYDLPEGMIAQEPSPERGASRLLVLERATGTVTHCVFDDLAGYLAAGDCLVLNQTRVIKARLIVSTSSGREAELLMVRPLDGSRWEVLAKPAKKVKVGDICTLGDGGERVRVSDELEGGRKVVDFGSLDPWQVMEKRGRVPLPPYIKREPQTGDATRYQTVYARLPGAVAAPTAGLHFTTRFLNRIDRMRVRKAAVCLHVGPGTFLPVRSERIEDHTQEKEYYQVDEEAAALLNRTGENGGRKVAVGTTVVRVLESFGRGPFTARGGWTELFIYPPYTFRNVDVLLTNFHLPRSTTLLLAASFAGRELLGEAYRQAIEKGYRFYSYGDAMLIL